MIDMTVQKVAAAVGGQLHGSGGERAVLGAVRDNREVQPGLMFCALPGARRDGHEFIEAALESGAPCCLAQRVPEGVAGPVITVPDVAKAMARLAEHCRGQVKAPVVGITGSSGKTTAKEMCARVLSRRFNTLKTEKNFNNELGVPLTIFRIMPETEAAVVELGISDFGEMSRLGAMARPDIAVYTLIGRSHLEALGDRRGVLRAKTELLDYMPDDGLVVVNGDDDLLAGLECRQRKLSFGLGAGCDLRAEDYRCLGAEGSEFTIVGCGRRIETRVSAYGRHMVYAALSAAAVGIELGVPDADIARGIADYEPVGRRASVIETGKITIVDDCYNANPDSTQMAIRSASDLGGRLVCILGDMLELGERSEEFHAETGLLARQAGAVLLTAGERAAAMGGRHYESKGALIADLGNVIMPGDRVLVKASHSMAFEEITEALKLI
ncbi:MAG TPA: UDP-N-acetylmuramoyl-tripeptide--D-alanyl-D-alanine ligase [Candidatus Scatomorpha pullistercoris]|uniref:UDP-N-acetylmuramoyl-tripeptide--D-alanyl-D-alanine ligase n=1 Tax=Candidatus Scatomorpha pullistercoris TaxID=2840929 RepID=A0A9D1G620_9FIRM|nr:UDP-N-acetylmuramoyl-tripeptide--D-alanyl-D-alanine ligase [Candidatus Scatomorpha pullistercoris]